MLSRALASGFCAFPQWIGWNEWPVCAASALRGTWGVEFCMEKVLCKNRLEGVLEKAGTEPKRDYGLGHRRVSGNAFIWEHET